MKIIENIVNPNNLNPSKFAAMYYKTEPFDTDMSRYVHTNNWEIYRAIEIIANQGFSIDLIDRSNHDWQPTKEYDLFLGLGVGNTGRLFPEYAKRSKAKKKVLLSMGPQPDTSNQLVLERYENFQNRTGYYAKPMRTVDMVTGDMFKEIVKETDYVFNIGEENNNSFRSLEAYGLKVLNFYPGISPKVEFDNSWLETRSNKDFLCFAGNGFICKGVDLLVEAFLENNHLNLHICGPNSETAFFEYYGNKIKKSENIKYHGFIQPGGDKFNNLAKTCSFVIFHSAAEGCCTSVATAMKAGLVPVVNSWTGINIDESLGYKIPEDGNKIENIISYSQKASSIDGSTYQKLVKNTLKKSELFSQKSFTDSYQKCLNKVLEN